MKTLGFWSGIKVSLLAFSNLSSQSRLRVWFLKAIVVTWVIAITVFVAAVSMGAWGLWSQYGQNWKSGLGAIGMVLAFCFISGTITSSLNNVFIMLIAGEKKLLIALSNTQTNEFFKVPFAVKMNEFKKIGQSILCSLFCWPLLLFPLTTPVGILLFAWVLGSECQATGEKIYLQLYGNSLPPAQKTGIGFAIGVALIPSVIGIFPFIGWTLLPSLPIAGFIAQQKIRETPKQ